MATSTRRLAGAVLLGVLLGTPAAGVVCALQCASPLTGGAAATIAGHGEGGCHQTPAPSAGLQLGRGDGDNCSDHALPEDADAAVLTGTMAAPSAPALATLTAVDAAVPASPPALSARPIRGPADLVPAASRPPLVLRI